MTNKSKIIMIGHSRIFIPVIVLASIFLRSCSGDYSVKINLLSFLNPSDRLLSGAHCDTFWWTGRDLCDIGLNLCVVPTQRLGLSFPTCNGQTFSTEDVTTNDDSAIFLLDTIYGQWKNPNTIFFTGLPFRGLHLKITALDYDGGLYGGTDVIDKMDFIISANAALNVNNLADIIHNRPSTAATLMKFQYTISCVNGYTGADCSIPSTGIISTTPQSCICPINNYTGITGTFKSPNYPNTYCYSMHCVYDIIVPTNYVMIIEFTAFSLGPGDYLTIYEESSAGPLLINKTGTQATTSQQVVLLNHAQMVFVSDTSGVGLGFTGSWTGYPDQGGIPSTSQPISSSSPLITSTPGRATTPLVCSNGGTSIGNIYCHCNPHFTGPGCETMLCQHGGTADGGICNCPPRTSGQYCENAYKMDCADLWKNYCISTSGVYNITSAGGNQIPVICDMAEDGGGWTVIQKRAINDNSTNFNQSFVQYQQGFGAMASSFWLGLDNIHFLTSRIGDSSFRPMSLMVVFTDCLNNRFNEYYPSFQLGQSSNYTLLVSNNGTGTGGDAFNTLAGFNQMQNGRQFSTYDKDTDGLNSFNCAKNYGSGWWFGACGASNLNGQYVVGCQQNLTVSQAFWGNGILWTTAYAKDYSLQSTIMKTRPTAFDSSDRVC